MPGERTCSGGAYSFQIPGALAAASDVIIPMRVHDAASIRCIYAYVTEGTSDGQSAFLVKYSKDDGATWIPLEFMGIAQNMGTPFRNTYDDLVAAGYGKPATRRLPYDDFGIIIPGAITAGGAPQTVSTASFGANRFGITVGDFLHINLGAADEESVLVTAENEALQQFTAVFSKNHAIGSKVRPSIWPTPILDEGDELAFDILGVASPNPGSDLTVVVQT